MKEQNAIENKFTFASDKFFVVFSFFGQGVF